MNIKTLCGMICRPDEGLIDISLGYDEKIVAKLDIENPFHMEAYGKFKVSEVRAMGVDSYEIIIATRPEQPITEE